MNHSSYIVQLYHFICELCYLHVKRFLISGKCLLIITSSKLTERCVCAFADGKDEDDKEANFQLDAAQRKKLPLWIREGLEKMEREKTKKVSYLCMHNYKHRYYTNIFLNNTQARTLLVTDAPPCSSPWLYVF